MAKLNNAPWRQVTPKEFKILLRAWIKAVKKQEEIGGIRHEEKGIRWKHRRR